MSYKDDVLISFIKYIIIILQEVFKMNDLKTVDAVFFILIIAIIALSVVVYFLLPVFNKKKYEQARAQLSEREKIYYENKKGHQE